MQKLSQYAGVVALVIATVAVYLALNVEKTIVQQTPDTLGASGTRFPHGIIIEAADSSSGLIIGTSTTARSTVTKIITGTCNLQDAETSEAKGSINATTTETFWCNVTGLTTGDKVFGSPQTAVIGAASSSPLVGPNNFGSLVFGAAGLSTTTGRILVPITNLTGAATTSFAQATTSYQYFIVR